MKIAYKINCRAYSLRGVRVTLMYDNYEDNDNIHDF